MASLLSGRRLPGESRNCTSGSSVANAFEVSRLRACIEPIREGGQSRLPGAALRCCRPQHRPASRGCREFRRPSCRRRPCGSGRCPSRSARGSCGAHPSCRPCTRHPCPARQIREAEQSTTDGNGHLASSRQKECAPRSRCSGRLTAQRWSRLRAASPGCIQAGR